MWLRRKLQIRLRVSVSRFNSCQWRRSKVRPLGRRGVWWEFLCSDSVIALRNKKCPVISLRKTAAGQMMHVKEKHVVVEDGVGSVFELISALRRVRSVEPSFEDLVLGVWCFVSEPTRGRGVVWQGYFWRNVGYVQQPTVQLELDWRGFISGAWFSEPLRHETAWNRFFAIVDEGR